MWPLFAEYSGLLSGVLSSTGHLKRRQEAAVSSTDYAVEENFGVLVKLVVQLLVKCSASAPEKETEKAGRLSVAQNLQTVLIQVRSNPSAQSSSSSPTATSSSSFYLSIYSPTSTPIYLCLANLCLPKS